MKIQADPLRDEPKVDMDIRVVVHLDRSFQGCIQYVLSKGIDTDGQATYAVFTSDESYDNPGKSAYHLERERAEKVLRKVFQFHYPVASETHVGLDGTTYTVEIICGMTRSLRFRWWGDVPSEWSVLSDLLELLNVEME